MQVLTGQQAILFCKSGSKCVINISKINYFLKAIVKSSSYMKVYLYLNRAWYVSYVAS